MGYIKAICISEKKGTAKTPVQSVTLKENFGIMGDAHAGLGIRQVSLLSADKIESFNASGADVNDGDFGENIILSGIDVTSLPIGTRLQSGDVVLEITKIGKECEDRCHIYYKMGDCIMPREGVFSVVLKGGELQVGQEIHVKR